MTMIFFNIAWMKEYKGVSEDDVPERGGSHELKHEVCNFADVNGRCYGFVQQKNWGNINLNKVGAASDVDCLDGITIVWTARSNNFGTVIVGIYRNARLHRKVQNLDGSDLHRANNCGTYYAECSARDALLLPITDRNRVVPRGKEAFGQRNIFYGDTTRGVEFQSEIESWVNSLFESRDKAVELSRKIDSGNLSRELLDETAAEIAEDIEAISKQDITASEKIVLINARIGQGKFREFLDALWNHSCAVTGCRVRAVLRASHIKPWRDCSTTGERLDPDNGLLLAAHLDALFDKGLIGFDAAGKMLVASNISDADRRSLGLTGVLRKRPTVGQQRYLSYHRQLHSLAA